MMESNKQQRILGVGSPIVDSLAHVDEEFLKSVGGAKGGMELIDSDTMRTLMQSLEGRTVEAPGGSAGNTIFALGRLGNPVALLGKTGNDHTGEFYRERLQQAGGDPSRLKIGNSPNGRCLALVTPDSERTMRTDLGAAMSLTPEEITATDFHGCSHAHIEGYLLFNRALMERVLGCAREAGCTVSLDLASFEVVNASADILPGILRDSVDIVFANEDEATAFCGKGKSYQDMARELASLCDIAAVKVGKAGAYVCKGESIAKIDPVPVARVVDTTGAGDFWAAGFLHGWAKGVDLTTAGSYGSLLGAEVVQILGAALPHDRWEEILRKIGSTAE